MEDQLYRKEGLYWFKHKGQHFRIPYSFNLPDGLEGAFIEDLKLDPDKGKFFIVYVEIEGVKYPINKMNSRNQYQTRLNHSTQKRVETNKNSNTSNPAVSPYNFVPINEKVVTICEEPVFDKFYTDRYTGYIDITITNKTELMVSKGVADNKDPERTHDFLRLGADNRVFIPGSTLRGLIRSTVGILSHSKLKVGEHYNDFPIYYRWITTEPYQPKFLNKTENNDYLAKAGYLKKEGSKYIIYPAIERKGTQYYKIRKVHDDGSAISPSLNDKKVPEFNFDGQKFVSDKFHFQSIYFQPQERTSHNHRGRKLKYALITNPNYSFKEQKDGFIKGNLVITGGFGRTKHDQWIVNLRGEARLEVPKSVIDSYNADKNRDENFNLIKELEGNSLVPCFYIPKKDKSGKIINEIDAIGHTPLFRIPHNNRFHDATIEQKTIGIGEYDLEETLFGVPEKFMGRVFFEDCPIVLGGEITNESVQYKPTLVKTLSEPKPTAHKLYLKQKEEEETQKQKDGKETHWSSEKIELNGTKQYWHKKLEDWRLPIKEGEKLEPHHTGYLKPVKPNNVFKGRIRFENLTDVELGALLSAINLPDGCCHKVGMAKPYGFGTIKVESKLVLIEKEKWYKELFNTTCPSTSKKGEELQNKFSDYLLKALGEKNTAIWNIERLQHFKAMLTYDEKKMGTKEWHNKTRYMEIQREIQNNKTINEFKQNSGLDNAISIYTKR